MGAECGLFKVDCHELVPVNLVHNDDDGDGDSDGDHGDGDHGDGDSDGDGDHGAQC